MLLEGFRFFVEAGVAHTVYLDACALNRLFDDQNQYRVKQETQAVTQILDLIKAGELKLVFSQAVKEEMIRNSNMANRIGSMASAYIARTPEIEERAAELHDNPLIRMGPYDSIHIASAESAGVDVLLTVDDRMVKKANRANVHVRLQNPVEWLKGTGFNRRASALSSQI